MPLTSSMKNPDAMLRELRLVPAFIGISCFLLSNRLYELSLLPPLVTSFEPYYWAWWMLISGCLCVLYSLHFSSRWLFAFSGAATVTGFMSRAMAAIFVIISEDESASAFIQLNIAGIIYTLVSGTIYVIWTRLLRPATTLLRRKG